MREDIKRRIEQIRRGEVPEGYDSETQIGILPKDWKINTIGEVVRTIVGGGTPSRRNAKYYEGHIPWVTVKDLNGDFYKCDATEHITSEAIEKSASKLIESGNVIVSTRMGLGRGFINKVPMAINQDMKALLLKTETSTEFFLYWYLNVGNRILELGGGSTVKGISLNTLRSISLPSPPHIEQERIAEILSTCDRVIELKKKLIEEKKKVKKWFMQTLLTGMIRVKDIENRTPYEELKKRIEQIRSGQVNEGYDCHKQIDILPKNWRIKSVGEVVRTIVGGGTPSRRNAKYYEGHIPWVTVKDLNCDFYKYDATEHITPEAIEKSASKFIESGNVIVSTRMGLGRGFINKVPMAINQDMKALLLKTEANAEFFLYWYLNVGRKIAELGGGSTVKGISLKTLRSIKLPFPPKDEQTQIAAILSTADKEIDLLNKDLEQWELKKKSLMQLLLTGIVRTKA